MKTSRRGFFGLLAALPFVPMAASTTRVAAVRPPPPAVAMPMMRGDAELLAWARANPTVTGAERLRAMVDVLRRVKRAPRPDGSPARPSLPPSASPVPR